MTYPRDKDSDPYKQEDYRHMQKKPKIDKMGIRPRQFVDQLDYHVMKQSTVQGAYDHARYIGSSGTIE